MNIYEKKKDKYVLINLLGQTISKKIINIINNIERFMVVDEQGPSGGLSSCVFEGFSDINFIKNNFKNFTGAIYI